MNVKKIGVIVFAISAIGIGAAAAQPLFQQPIPGGEPGLMREIADIVLDETGLTPRELRDQLRDGSTVADLIIANGGNVDTVIDEVISSVTERVNQAVEDERITQARADQILADLELRVTEVINGEGMFLGRGGERGGRFGGRGDFGGRGERGGRGLQGLLPLMDSLTNATRLDLTDIAAQLQEGLTLSEIITENGGDVEAVITDALAAATEQANAAVADGRITQEQADTMLERLETRYRNLLDSAATEGDSV